MVLADKLYISLSLSQALISRGAIIFDTNIGCPAHASSQQCRKSFYCWYHVCLCLYPNHELYISLSLSKALISRWIIFISWTSLILPKSCQLSIIYSLSQQIFRCPSKKLPSLLRPSICFYFFVSFYELLFHFLCFFTI